jgi:hypothetical protein
VAQVDFYGGPGDTDLSRIASEEVPQTDASYRSVAATRSPTNLRSVPVAENLTHL